MPLTSSDTALLTAVEAADAHSVSQCLKQSANINAASENGWTPLMLAVLHGSSAIVKLLLEHGADPNIITHSQENPSRSALVVAVSNGRFELVQVLVAHGADAQTQDAAGLTAVALAEKLALRPFHKDKMVAIASFLRENTGSNIHRVLETAAA